jgi:hypothetical protein
MSLRDFLNASYALLVEGYTSVGHNRIGLMEAMEKLNGLIPQEEKPAIPSAPPVSPEQQMRALLANVKGAPV